ncbi:MAG TPA: flagellar export chaperone FlgN [Phycisphaerae bacterium]|nr:flagellar export chaperone FlgN [Phycisphaerae bacterium]HNU46735.1 flagellar export chaperone FlgN [Phycisphaerae bacterium]
MNQPRPANGTERQRLADLRQLLETLRGLHQQLLETIERKLAAMRRADFEALRVATMQEQQLVHSIQEREGLRRQLADLLGQQLGLPARGGRTLTVAQLAECLAGPARQGLLETADALRAVMNQVVQVNRSAEAVTRRMLEHFEAIFASLAGLHGPAGAYAGNGGAVGVGTQRILETVG